MRTFNRVGKHKMSVDKLAGHVSFCHTKNDKVKVVGTVDHKDFIRSAGTRQNLKVYQEDHYLVTWMNAGQMVDLLIALTEADK